jgi:RNA polymerase sigma factor (sigma-70 family)
MEASQRQRLQENLSLLARGQREAFTPVFDILWPIYRRFARKSLPEGDAEDAAQEALLKLFVRANEFDPSRDASVFAIGVAYHEIRTWRRKRWRRREDPAEMDQQRGVVSTPHSAREEEELIEWGLSQLPDADRETLGLYAQGERSTTVTAVAFRKRVQRALERLRAIVRLG